MGFGDGMVKSPMLGIQPFDMQQSTNKIVIPFGIKPFDMEEYSKEIVIPTSEGSIVDSGDETRNIFHKASFGGGNFPEAKDVDINRVQGEQIRKRTEHAWHAARFAEANNIPLKHITLFENKKISGVIFNVDCLNTVVTKPGRSIIFITKNEDGVVNATLPFIGSHIEMIGGKGEARYICINETLKILESMGIYIEKSFKANGISIYTRANFSTKHINSLDNTSNIPPLLEVWRPVPYYTTSIDYENVKGYAGIGKEMPKNTIINGIETDFTEIVKEMKPLIENRVTNYNAKAVKDGVIQHSENTMNVLAEKIFILGHIDKLRDISGEDYPEITWNKYFKKERKGFLEKDIQAIKTKDDNREILFHMKTRWSPIHNIGKDLKNLEPGKVNSFRVRLLLLDDFKKRNPDMINVPFKGTFIVQDAFSLEFYRIYATDLSKNKYELYSLIAFDNTNLLPSESIILSNKLGQSYNWMEDKHMDVYRQVLNEYFTKHGEQPPFKSDK
jgi:hypothetical protein